MFSDIKTLIGAGAGVAIGAAAVLGWSVMIYGPAQYDAGGIEMAARLTAATNEAAKGLSDDAEAYRLKLSLCNPSGRVFDYVRGECEQR